MTDFNQILYKQPHKDSFIGGPAYYIQRGLHKRRMAVLFAVLNADNPVVGTVFSCFSQFLY